MKVLSVDTSTHICRAGIFDSERGIIADISVNLNSKHQRRHTEVLINLIEEIIVKSQMTLDEIDLIAVIIGPGSYTGLRAGVSTVKGLAFTLNKPIVPVNTLEALAWNFSYCALPICATISAKKNELHCAIYRWSGDDLIDTGLKGLYKIDRFNELITEKTIIAGDAVLQYSEFIKENTDCIFPRLNLHSISISAVAAAAISMVERYGIVDASIVVPRYSLG
jgi:tRNA threonylcarbamoyladenosine biosynthesis protein TsaB